MEDNTMDEGLAEQLNNIDSPTPEPKKEAKSKGGKYAKGTSGNPKGRPKGTKNGTTQEIRNFLQAVMDDNLPKLQSDLDRMSPSQRWTILEKLTNKYMPNLTQADIQANVNGSMKIIIVQDGEEEEIKTKE